jgi:hypothetical protein
MEEGGFFEKVGKKLRGFGESIGLIRVHPYVRYARQQLKGVRKHERRFEFASAYDKLARIARDLGREYELHGRDGKALHQYEAAREAYGRAGLHREAGEMSRKISELNTRLESRVGDRIGVAAVFSMILGSLFLFPSITGNMIRIEYDNSASIGILFFILVFVLIAISLSYKIKKNIKR